MKKTLLLMLSMTKDLMAWPMDEFTRDHLERVVELLEQVLETE